MIIKRKLYSIDVNAEGRGGALIGGTAGFFPGAVVGAVHENPIAGMAIGTIGGALIGRAIARAKAKNRLKAQLDTNTKIIPTAGDISKELRGDRIPAEYNGNMQYQKAWREYKDDPRIKELEALCDDSELNDFGEKVDIGGLYGSKFICRPFKNATLSDGSSMIYDIGDYHDGNGIAIKDGKLYPVYQYIREDRELTKKDLHNFFENAKEKFNDEDEEDWDDYDKNGLRFIPRNPNNPEDKAIIDYSNLAQSKIKNLKTFS